jgi:hypothetical protein
MITRLLAQQGLFMGWRRDMNDEAFFFVRLNEWLLAETGHAWDNPPDAAGWPGEATLRQALLQGLRAALPAIDAIRYWGLRGMLAHRNPFGARFPWGWKDPRNTITLPLWLDIFPDARVVHIRRHGLDVARSLTTRNKAIGEKIHNQGVAARLPFTRMKPLWLSSRCGQIADAFTLWEEYMQHAKRHLDALGQRAFDIRYEDFMESPAESLARIADFCGLHRADETISRAYQTLDSNRAYAYRSDPNLVEFEKRYSDRLAAHGY